MVPALPFISDSTSPCTNPLVTVPKTPITIYITVNFMLHSFSVLVLGLGTYLSFRFLSILLGGQPGRQSPLFSSSSFFFVIITGLVVGPKFDDLFVFQNPREFCASDFLELILVVHIAFVCVVKFESLAQFPVIISLMQSYLVISSFCANLQYSLWLIVLSLSPLNLHFLRLVYSSFDIVCPYGVVLCYYQKRFSFSLLAFLFSI